MHKASLQRSVRLCFVSYHLLLSWFGGMRFRSSPRRIRRNRMFKGSLCKQDVCFICTIAIYVFFQDSCNAYHTFLQNFFSNALMLACSRRLLFFLSLDIFSCTRYLVHLFLLEKSYLLCTYKQKKTME